MARARSGWPRPPSSPARGRAARGERHRRTFEPFGPLPPRAHSRGWWRSEDSHAQDLADDGAEPQRWPRPSRRPVREHRTAPSLDPAHHRGPHGVDPAPHQHRPRATDRHPRASGVGRRRRTPSAWRPAPPPTACGGPVTAHEDIEVLVNCSITKYREGLTQWLEPTMSLAVAQQIGATDATTFDLANACAGMLTGVFVVANRIRRGEIECGMVVSGEYISQLGQNAAKHVRNVLSRELASLTLGDAGAAVIIERAPRASPASGSPGSPPSPTTAGCASPTRPDTTRAPGCSPSPGRSIASPSPTRPSCSKRPWTPPGSRSPTWTGSSPTRPRPGPSAREWRSSPSALGGLPKNPAVVTVDHYGNTASTTHFVALVEELEAGNIHSGDRVALIALASGLEIGVVVFTADERLGEPLWQRRLAPRRGRHGVGGRSTPALGSWPTRRVERPSSAPVWKPTTSASS